MPFSSKTSLTTFVRTTVSAAALFALLTAIPLASAALTSTANAADGIRSLLLVSQAKAQKAAEDLQKAAEDSSNKTASKKSAKKINNRAIKTQSDFWIK